MVGEVAAQYIPAPLPSPPVKVSPSIRVSGPSPVTARSTTPPRWASITVLRTVAGSLASWPFSTSARPSNEISDSR